MAACQTDLLSISALWADWGVVVLRKLQHDGTHADWHAGTHRACGRCDAGSGWPWRRRCGTDVCARGKAGSGFARVAGENARPCWGEQTGENTIGNLLQMGPALN